MRFLVLVLALCSVSPAFGAEVLRDASEGAGSSVPVETPILVPSPIPVGFLLAWKPTIISVRVDTGGGSSFGSDKPQLLRGLARYTTTMFGEKLLARGEIEGGRFQTDTEGTQLGSDGWDVTMRLLGGTAVQIYPGFVITGSAGLLTRYQHGTHQAGGAPRIGMFGATSNAEFQYRIFPLFTVAMFVEGGIAPISYGAQDNLGNLSDASEFRWRLQVSIDIARNAALDVGYDYTRWHTSFTQATLLDPTRKQAMLIETREHAITFGIRWKP